MLYFQIPSAYLKESLGNGSRPIVSPSFRKSIPVRALIITDVSRGIRAVQEPPTMKRRGRGNESCKRNHRLAPTPPQQTQTGASVTIFSHIAKQFPGNYFEQKRGGKITITIKRQHPSSSPSPSWRICNLLLKSSFSATKINICYSSERFSC